MATTQSTNEAIATFVRDTELAHQIVHGGDTAQVQTDGGLVDTYAKTIKDLQDAGDAAIAALDTSVNQNADGVLAGAVAARDAAAASATQAANEATSAETAVGLAFTEATNAQNARVGAEAARDAAQLSRGIFASTADALSNGVISLASVVGGTGGANGTFDLAFSGGGGTGAAGRFVVAGGAVVSHVITANGRGYTSAPTVSFAASAGLTGASATAVITNNTDSGEYFSVPSADNAEYLILYLNSVGVAVEQKTYPSVSAIENFEDAARRVEEQPNLFTRAQLSFAELPLLAAGTSVASTSSGLDVVAAATETVGGVSRIYWRFPVSMFPSGLVSAQITLMSDSGGTSGTIGIIQRNSSNVTVQTDNFASGLSAAISSPITYRTPSPVVIAGTTAFVELNVQLNKSTGDKLRAWTARAMLVADGSSSIFRLPPAVIPTVPTISYFPNPALTQASSTKFEAATIIESGENALEMTGVGHVKQVFYEVPAIGVLAHGNSITLNAESFSDVVGVNASADIAFVFLDSSGATIGTVTTANVSTAGVYQTLSTTQTVPAGTAKVRFRFVKRTAAAVARFKRITTTSTSTLGNVVNEGVSASASSAAGLKTVFVSTSGDDAAAGEIGSPLRTIAAAVALAGKNGRIVMRGGDYSAGASIAGIDRLLVTAYIGERVRFILGTALTGITKTAGYTKVYQADLAAKPTRWVWEHGTPDARTLISAADRHPLQRGRQYRLPSTRLDEVASIAAIDAASTPSWYWSAGVLYFSASDGGDASAREYRVPVSSNGAIYGGTGVEDVRVENISVWYGGSNGFDARNLARWEANNCAALFCATNGFSRDDTRFAIERLCEAAGNGNDGFNAHRYAANANHEQVTSTCFDNWTHDNYDDGDSLHEDNLGTYYGGLYEYNGDRGIATSYGAHTTAYGSVSRYNGQIDPTGGEGFCAIGPVNPSMDNGVGTQMDCYDCQSYGNRYNYATGAADAKMTVVNSKSKNAGNTHFAALAGTIKLVDCGASGTGTLKYGNVTVENTTLVV